MANKQDLYGFNRPKKNSAKEISSSTSLAFTSQLSSLLSSSGPSSRAASGRPRRSKSSDIFTSHNKNIKKRAAKDLEDNGEHSRRLDIGGVDDAILHRSKRKMEEKARLYKAMKRGDYLAPEGDPSRNAEENGLVDFDRKWVENEARGKEAEGDETDPSSYEDDEDEGEELVEYTDEFGRQRQGSRAEVAREERRKRLQAADKPDRFSARPSQPTNLIYGDTVQAAAFNPDEPIAAKIEELARKRDRSLTPPPEVHYDAKSEVRSKGVGFYAFSQDKAGREKEMQALERERVETEKIRREKEDRLKRRKMDIEERRRKIQERRGERLADDFLDGLGAELGQDDKQERAHTEQH